MNHTLMLTAIYGKTRLNLQEVAHCLNISYQTARHQRSNGTFPITMAGHPLTADVSAVGEHLQSLSAVSSPE